MFSFDKCHKLGVQLSLSLICMVVTFDFVFVSGLFLGLGLGYCFGLLVEHDLKNSS